MASGERGVDFVTIDGGEGGTGAAPLVFADAVSPAVPAGVHAGSTGCSPRPACTRTSIFIGVRQARACRTTPSSRSRSAATWSTSPARRCWRSAASRRRSATPTAARPASPPRTPWLAHGLDPSSKSVRVANYVKTLRRDLLKVAEACGVEHPGLIDADDVEILDGDRSAASLREVYGYEPAWGLPSAEDQAAIPALMEGSLQGSAATTSSTGS